MSIEWIAAGTDDPSSRVHAKKTKTSSIAMMNVKEATQVALEYFQDLYSDQTFSNVLLEEVERDEEDNTAHWFITIGFTDEKAAKKERTLMSKPAVSSRRYKRFKINAETGEVVSMKIRSVENA